MKRISLQRLVVLVVVALGTILFGTLTSNGYGQDGLLRDYGAGLIFDAEALFFKYNRADGTRVGGRVVEAVDFDYLATPRLTLGWISGGGLGFRTRYFEYDQRQVPLEVAAFPNSALNIDTYTIDIEVFERIALSDCWDIELSGGLRYNEFDELMIDDDAGPNDEERLNAFTGWGGVAGLQANRSIGRLGDLYGRMRGAVMTGDKLVINEDGASQTRLMNDSVQGMLELAIGWEYLRELPRGSLLTLGVGYEWQAWYNYSSSLGGPVGSLLQEHTFGGPSDVGFNGFTVMVGIER